MLSGLERIREQVAFKAEATLDLRFDFVFDTATIVMFNMLCLLDAEVTNYVKATRLINLLPVTSYELAC